MRILKSNTLKFIFKLLVSITLLFLIFRFIGVNKVYNELLNANIYYMAAALFLAIFPIFFKAIRWRSIIQIFNKTITIKSSINYTLISIAFSIVTPGRLGEFIKAKYLVDSSNMRYIKSIVTVVIDKIFDIMTIVLLGLIGLSFLKEIEAFSSFFIYASVFYILVIILILIYFDKVLKLISYILSKKYKNSFEKFTLNRTFYIKGLLFSLLIWITLSTEAFFILKALNFLSPSFYVVISIVPLMALSSMLPISIGGMGVRELISIYFLSVIGIQAEKSVIFSLIYTLVSAGIPAIMGAILYIKGK
jgi:hypothetical protein|tara:strand:+ start:4047 stop:4961 length:915 start_codon:yes stop_codon:yes gene_type:complete